jgi:3-oxoacyl-[acyl-carrier-protein] synthase-3
MNGKEIFKSAVRVMEKATRELLEANGLETKDVDHVIPHQANVRIVGKYGSTLRNSS